MEKIERSNLNKGPQYSENLPELMTALARFELELSDDGQSWRSITADEFVRRVDVWHIAEPQHLLEALQNDKDQPIFHSDRGRYLRARRKTKSPQG